MLCARVMRGISSTAKAVDTGRRRSPASSLHAAQRPQETDQHLPPAQQRKVALPGLVVGAIAQHLHDDVGGGEDLFAAGGNLRPLAT